MDEITRLRCKIEKLGKTNKFTKEGLSHILTRWVDTNLKTARECIAKEDMEGFTACTNIAAAYGEVLKLLQDDAHYAKVASKFLITEPNGEVDIPIKPSGDANKDFNNLIELLRKPSHE